MGNLNRNLKPVVVNLPNAYGAGASIYDLRSEHVMGPIFDSLAECRLFICWCDSACIDPADMTPGQLGDHVAEWNRTVKAHFPKISGTVQRSTHDGSVQISGAVDSHIVIAR